MIGRIGGNGVTGTKFNMAPVTPAAGSIYAGTTPFTLNTAAGRQPVSVDAGGTPLTHRSRRCACATGPAPRPNEPLRQETVQADYATSPAQTANGGAIIATRDAVTFGFGIEQVPEAARNELVRRSMQHLLPTGADTTPPTVVGFKYPTNLSTATPRDPVELELTAFDERGDMDRVDLYADGALHSSVPVYPFQFRYTPPTSKIGGVVKLTAEAFDKAGNKSTRDLYVNVIAGTTAPASPVAVAPPSLLGTPVVGEQLACINGGFTNQPTSLTYAWLRSGTVIAAPRRRRTR